MCAKWEIVHAHVHSNRLGFYSCVSCVHVHVVSYCEPGLSPAELSVVCSGNFKGENFLLISYHGF